jgi:hypothetical protein
MVAAYFQWASSPAILSSILQLQDARFRLVSPSVFFSEEVSSSLPILPRHLAACQHLHDIPFNPAPLLAFHNDHILWRFLRLRRA